MKISEKCKYVKAVIELNLLFQPFVSFFADKPFKSEIQIVTLNSRFETIPNFNEYKVE